KHHKLIIVGRFLGAEAFRAMGFERLWAARWEYSVQVSRNCCAHAYAHNRGRATQPRIKVDIRAHPPKQHPTANTEIDACSREIAEAQMGKRFEPRYDCEAKGEPEEQNYRD